MKCVFDIASCLEESSVLVPVHCSILMLLGVDILILHLRSCVKCIADVIVERAMQQANHDFSFIKFLSKALFAAGAVGLKRSNLASKLSCNFYGPFKLASICYWWKLVAQVFP